MPPIIKPFAPLSSFRKRESSMKSWAVNLNSFNISSWRVSSSKFAVVKLSWPPWIGPPIADMSQIVSSNLIAWVYSPIFFSSFSVLEDNFLGFSSTFLIWNVLYLAKSYSSSSSGVRTLSPNLRPLVFLKWFLREQSRFFTSWQNCTQKRSFLSNTFFSRRNASR